jgi:hypothetical protein
MRSLGTVLVGLCIANGAAQAQECSGLQLPRSHEKPSAAGTITDARTNKPLSFVVVVVDSYPLGISDCSGHYEIVPSDAGSHRLLVDLRGYISAAEPVTFVPGETQTVNIVLVPAQSPCCRLAGLWSIALHMDSAGAIGPPPTSRDVSGTLAFADTIPFPIGRPADNDQVRQEAGRYAIDFTPFFGAAMARDVSSTTFGSSEGTFLVEAIGTVFAGDSVTVDLIPRISHGGASMSGRIVGDSVKGFWYQRAYCCGAWGTFAMWRTNAGKQ